MRSVLTSRLHSVSRPQVLVSRDGAVCKALGWVVKKPLAKQDTEDAETMAPARDLVISFDLKEHTARALSRVLREKPREQFRRPKGGEAALPMQVAGKRPTLKPEAFAEKSRHLLVTKPATVKLCFNCHNAAFEVTNWTGHAQPFSKLPLEQTFDLVGKASKKRLGRVKLAFDLNTTFLDRVEFPDEWMLAEDYAVHNDGWQGKCDLELELVWGKEVATITVQPWLAYSASVGARIIVRKVSQPFGQCATIQRVLQDDRCVARIDGHSKADGVQGETIVDLMPATVVLTTFPHYARGTKLLVIHDGMLVDASVIHWVGSTEASEGSRHMILVRSPGSPAGMPGTQAWHDLSPFNHTATSAAMDAAMYESRRARYCQFLTETESLVEDAITGNKLKIKDQLIFMSACPVPGGCNPPQYTTIRTVPQLINEQLEASPKRHEGTHVAQAVLCRAGPGTGKTWMIKQSLFLLASKLADDKTAGSGVRLLPIVVYVQRVVRLLREHGDDPSELLQDPNGLMRWYLSKEFAERPEELEMTLTAHQLTALVILVDGVDEAAGMRDIVEAFVHYELVTSGNRLVVTSRPEGVDLEDYKVCVTTITRQPTIVTLRPSPRLRNRPCTCRDYIERRFPRFTSPFLACRLLPLLSRRRAIRSALR
jgi:hypothetical protein